jgi:hypothetical protein
METELRVFEPHFMPGDLTVEGFRGPPTAEAPAGKAYLILRYSGIAGVSYAFVEAEFAQQLADVIAKLGAEMIEQVGVPKLIVPGLAPGEIERIRKDLNGKGGT